MSIQNIHRLNEIVAGITFAASADDLEMVLQRIAHTGRELAKTRYAALGIPNNGKLKYFKVSGQVILKMLPRK